MSQRTDSDIVKLVDDDSVHPFRVEISREAIDDLRRRLAAVRWPAGELVDDRSQGVQLATVQALADCWGNDYDFGGWRRD
jgi:hypothetical protein